MSKKNTEVSRIAEVFAPAVSIDKEGVATFADGVFAQALPEGLTIDQYKAGQQFNSNVGQAVAKVVGEKAIPVLKDNPDLKEVVGKLPTIDRESFEVSVLREREVRSPKTGEVSTQYGATAVRHRTSTGRGSGFNAIKQAIIEEATAALGKK